MLCRVNQSIAVCLQDQSDFIQRIYFHPFHGWVCPRGFNGLGIALHNRYSEAPRGRVRPNGRLQGGMTTSDRLGVQRAPAAQQDGGGMRDLIEKTKVGDEIKLKILREKKPMELTIKLGKRP